jgi:hypothetical protein
VVASWLCGRSVNRPGIHGSSRVRSSRGSTEDVILWHLVRTGRIKYRDARTRYKWRVGRGGFRQFRLEPRAVSFLIELAQKHTESAAATLVSAMKDPKASAQARGNGTNALLDRAMGSRKRLRMGIVPARLSELTGVDAIQFEPNRIGQPYRLGNAVSFSILSLPPILGFGGRILSAIERSYSTAAPNTAIE